MPPTKKLIFSLLIFIASPQNTFSCTIWSAHGDDWVKGGGTLIAKNRDWRADHQQVLKTISPKKGYRYFGIFAECNDEPGLKAGINEQGLVVISSAAGSISHKLRKESEKTRGLLVKLLTECDSVEAALKKEKMFIGPKNMMVADKTKIARIEIALHGQHSVSVKQNGVLSQTNHYLDEKLSQFNQKTGESSRCRHQRITELLDNHTKPYALADFIAFSQDRHEGPDNSIWRTGSSPQKEVTLSTWIAYLPEEGKPQLYIKIANPQEKEQYHRLNFEDIF